MLNQVFGLMLAITMAGAVPAVDQALKTGNGPVYVVTMPSGLEKS